MLVVDDNKVIRQLIRVNLELEGLEVVTASDGVECLEVVHQVRPDLVTLDVVMPRLDGLRTAARLRADPRTHDLPLAVISACTQYEVEAGVEAGVDAFLSKPFDPAELVRLVRRLIDGRRAAEGSGGPASPDGMVGLAVSLGAGLGPAPVTPGHDLPFTLPLSSGSGSGSGDDLVSPRDEPGSGHGRGPVNGGNVHGHPSGPTVAHGHPSGPNPAGPLAEPVAD